MTGAIDVESSMRLSPRSTACSALVGVSLTSIFSGVNSLNPVVGGGGIFLVSSSVVMDTDEPLLRSLLAMLSVLLRLPFGAGSRLGVFRL